MGACSTSHPCLHTTNPTRQHSVAACRWRALCGVFSSFLRPSLVSPFRLRLPLPTFSLFLTVVVASPVHVALMQVVWGSCCAVSGLVQCVQKRTTQHQEKPKKHWGEKKKKKKKKKK